MSNIDCSACNDLRDYAPEFVQNGVNENVATSLKNGTGLNPSLTVLHENCDDLQDVNDCLVGRMKDEIEAYDICDWKDFMRKFIGNLYETLKAIIMSVCRIDNLCDSVDSILHIVGGTDAKNHFATPTSTYTSKFVGKRGPDGVTIPLYTKPSLQAEIRDGAGCHASKKLAVWRVLFASDTDISPYVPGISVVSALQVGDVLGTIRKSDVVPHDMPEELWNNLMKGIHSNTSRVGLFGTANNATQLNLTLAGHIILDGVEFNPHLAAYGDDVMCVTVWGFIGEGRTGDVSGSAENLHIYVYEDTQA